MRLNKLINVIRYIRAIPKSIYVNFRLLPIKQAIKLPILVSSKTKIQSLSGNVILKKVKPAIVRIGFGSTDMIDYSYKRTLLKIDGEIIFEGKTKIGMGSRIMVNGKLIIGKNFRMTGGESMIICEKEIKIGINSMLGWDSMLMDSDQHNIFDINNNIINEVSKITLGDNVWIGAKVFILKGVSVGNGCIVGANTTLSKTIDIENAIIAGNPLRVIKKDIRWK